MTRSYGEIAKIMKCSKSSAYHGCQEIEKRIRAGDKEVIADITAIMEKLWNDDARLNEKL